MTGSLFNVRLFQVFDQKKAPRQKRVAPVQSVDIPSGTAQTSY